MPSQQTLVFNFVETDCRRKVNEKEEIIAGEKSTIDGYLVKILRVIEPMKIWLIRADR